VEIILVLLFFFSQAEPTLMLIAKNFKVFLMPQNIFLCANKIFHWIKMKNTS